MSDERNEEESGRSGGSLLALPSVVPGQNHGKF